MSGIDHVLYTPNIVSLATCFNILKNFHDATGPYTVLVAMKSS